MSERLVIRASRPDEAGVVFDLVRELAVYEKLDAPQFFHLTPADVARDFYGADRKVHADIALFDGEAVGVCLWYRTYSSFRAATGIFLEDVFVRETHRGHGIGKAFFAHLARIAAQEGGARIDWSVLDWNEKAIGFYRSMGAAPHDGWTYYRLQGEPLKALATV